MTNGIFAFIILLGKLWIVQQQPPAGGNAIGYIGEFIWVRQMILFALALCGAPMEIILAVQISSATSVPGWR